MDYDLGKMLEVIDGKLNFLIQELVSKKTVEAKKEEKKAEVKN